MSRSPSLGRDDGSVLPLVIGFVVLVVLLVTVVTDVGALWLQRRAVQATVDGAALAGAQAVDLPTVYAGGAHGDLPLDPSRVRAAVRSYVAAVPAGRQLSAFRITAVRVVGPTVSVTGSSAARLPFLSWLTGRGVRVIAQASARTTTAG